MSRVSHRIDRIEVTFDDETLVANAGLIVPATLMVRLGLEALVNSTVRLVGRVGGALPGRKVLHVGGHDPGGRVAHRSRRQAARGRDQEVLPFRVMAPSTLGTFLRAFTFGHVRQLDAVIAETIRRAWSLGAGPGRSAMTIDLDSTICEVHGKQKHGAAYGYTKVLGYHPIAGHPGRHRRGAARPAAQGIVPAGREAIRRRAHRPGPARRRHRRAGGARRCRVLVLRAHRHAHAVQPASTPASKPGRPRKKPSAASSATSPRCLPPPPPGRPETRSELAGVVRCS